MDESERFGVIVDAICAQPLNHSVVPAENVHINTSVVLLSCDQQHLLNRARINPAHDLIHMKREFVSVLLKREADDELVSAIARANRASSHPPASAPAALPPPPHSIEANSV
jgi:hypothetical protein